jgi:LmbE family N-acetylglucosaminyl deacetylase
VSKSVLVSIAVAIVLVIGVGAYLFWMDNLFEEPEATFVSSIAGEVGATSVLAIFAHPDDEQLITGLLIRAAEHDKAVTRMITATKGEAGTPLPKISRTEELGIIRHAELLKNGYALGVKEQLVWDYPDSGLANADFDVYVERLVQQMIRWKPDLVVTFWPESGFSDHSDHKTAGKAAQEAVKRLQEKHPEIAPKAIAYILAPRPMMDTFGGDMGKRIVANQPLPTHAMPGESWAKIRGWNIHASQRDYVKKAYGFPAWFVHRLYDKEHYYLEYAE